MTNEQQLIDSVKNGDLLAFGRLYDEYYILLCTIAQNYLKTKFLAEEIVGDVFLNIWEKRERLNISVSLKAYLIRSVQNRCNNYLEHLKVEKKLIDKTNAEHHISGMDESSDYPLGQLYEKELASLIQHSVDALPEHCKKIFLLSRNEELSYEEIAAHLNISINTVKTQMKIALFKLREFLKDYLSE